MATPYDLYYVSSYNIVDGKAEEARAWLDRALPFWEGLPGVIGIRTFAAQFANDDPLHGADMFDDARFADGTGDKGNAADQSFGADDPGQDVVALDAVLQRQHRRMRTQKGPDSLTGRRRVP